MKQNLIKLVLLAAALLWVSLMSLFAVTEGHAVHVPAEDGSKAIIKFIDRNEIEHFTPVLGKIRVILLLVEVAF